MTPNFLNPISGPDLSHADILELPFRDLLALQLLEPRIFESCALCAASQVSGASADDRRDAFLLPPLRGFHALMSQRCDMRGQNTLKSTSRDRAGGLLTTPCISGAISACYGLSRVFAA